MIKFFLEDIVYISNIKFVTQQVI